MNVYEYKTALQAVREFLTEFRAAPVRARKDFPSLEDWLIKRGSLMSKTTDHLIEKTERAARRGAWMRLGMVYAARAVVYDIRDELPVGKTEALSMATKILGDLDVLADLVKPKRGPV